MEWVALTLVLLASVSVVYFTLRTGISPMPSTRLQREALLAAAGETAGPIYELGAGWGSLAFAFADRFPNAQVTAFEVSWVPFLVLWLRQRVRPRRNLTVRCADFRKAPLDDARLLVCYLYRGGMAALKSKLEKEAPGARLISHTFSVHGWTPDSEQALGDMYRTAVFVYTVPRRGTPTESLPRG